ncbi:monocarboxylate transporter 14-like [Diadema antillarum]|uniref:monocarboxylate transporter 14-like n=1 Tax=Diadema antillarum TaxID=105358 RepID=UPI003A8A9111
MCTCCDRFSCPGILPRRFQHLWKWIVTASLAIVYFVSWGNIHSYPLLFGPLQDDFKSSAIETGWVGSVTIGVNSLASPLAAFLERKVGFRMTVILGILLSSVGVFVSSFAPQLFYLYFTYGVMYGLGINLTYHTSLCLMVQYFPNSNCRRATSIIMCGGTTGMLVFSTMMERIIRGITWRGALRVSGSIVLILGMPFALLCKSPEETASELCAHAKAEGKGDGSDAETGSKSKRGLKKVHPEDAPVDDKRAWRSESSEEEDDCPEMTEKTALRDGVTHEKTAHYKCEKLDTKEKEVLFLLEDLPEEPAKSDFKKWLTILGNWKCWLFIVSIFISTFSWSFYWVNLVSHLSDLGFSQRQGAYVLTTCAAAELAAKILLAAVGDRLPLSNVTILGIQGLVTSAFTIGVMFIRNFGGGMGIILGVGAMRGVYQVVPYMSCVEIIGQQWGDEAQTLTLVVQGIGYLVGALPSGAIYDITQSYRTCLMMVFVLFIASSMALYIIQLFDRFCANKPKAQCVDINSKTVSVPEAFVRRHEIVLDRVTSV